MVTLHTQHALLRSGWERNVRITVDAGRIGSVTTGVAPEVGDHRCTALVPGMANLHSHAHQRVMAGLTEQRGDEQDSFWSWRQVMYGLLADIGPEHLEHIAAQVYREMLEAGFTAVGEFHYLHHAPDGTPYDNPAELSHRICAAAETSGIGMTLLPVRYARGGVNDEPTSGAQARFHTGRDSYERLHGEAARAVNTLGDDARIGVAPHSLRAVGPADLNALVAMAPNGPVHIHIAEQRAEVVAVRDACGTTPVAWLLDHQPVDQRWALIHATHVTEAEVRGMAATGAVAGLCPITEANLGDGIFPAREFLDRDGRMGIGSDSNVRISLAEELRMLEYSQRLRDERRAVLAAPGGSTGAALYGACVVGGAQALGRPAGRIEAGLVADLVALDTGAVALAAAGPSTWLDGWVFAGDDRAVVRDVWSAGRHVVRDGRHVNAGRIEADYRSTARALFP